jgi:ribonuclease P protein component
MTSFPVKVIFSPVPDAEQTKAMFVVPKRNFRKAHDRNKLKRRMKEAYRLNKAGFYEKLKENKLHIAFLYTGRTAEDYNVIEAAIISLIVKVAAKF